MNEYCLINISTGIKTQPLCKNTNKININLEEYEKNFRINKNTLNITPEYNKRIINITNNYKYGDYNIVFLWESEILNHNYQQLTFKLYSKNLKDIQLLENGILITSIPNKNLDSSKLKEIIDEINEKKISIKENVKYLELDLLQFLFSENYLNYLNKLLVLCEKTNNVYLDDNSIIIPHKPDNIELLVNILG